MGQSHRRSERQKLEGSVSMCRAFFFQAEDGIRDLVRSRGLGDVYKRQVLKSAARVRGAENGVAGHQHVGAGVHGQRRGVGVLSLIHI